MELLAHRAMTSDARLLRGDGAASLRLVTQATFLLVTGPTAIVDAEEIDDDLARWLEDDAPAAHGAAVVVLGAGASGVAASGERVALGPDGRGARRLPGTCLAAGAEIAVDTADAGTVATRLPAEGPAAWIEIDGARRPLPLRPVSLRIDLVGLRLSIAWCAAAPVDGASDDARVIVHAGTPTPEEAPRSTRPPPAARPVPVMRRAPRREARTLSEATPHEWDVDSTVSIDGTAPPSLPLPFHGADAEPSRRAGGDAPSSPPPPPRLAPPPSFAAEERRSIGQILAGRAEPAAPAPAERPAPMADPSRAGRARMGERSAAPEEPPRPAVRAAVAPLVLLHVEAGASSRLRRGARWRALLSAPSRAATRAAEEAGDDAAAARDARDVVAALRGAPATPLDALQAELHRAVDDGLLVAPLLVVDGELELPLDEIELLRATVDALTPLRGADRRVEEALERARPLVDAPWLDPSAAEAERAHLRGVVAALGRGQTADALDAQVERKLRRDRKHPTRAWRGATWVVAAVGADGARTAVLLPRTSLDVLPIARRFRARLLVEAQPSIEPDVADTPTLLAIAIAREVPPAPSAAAPRADAKA